MNLPKEKGHLSNLYLLGSFSPKDIKDKTLKRAKNMLS